MEQKLYTLVKLPLKALINSGCDIKIDRKTEIDNEYLITQGDSLLFDQIERLRGRPSSHIGEVILVTAKKNPRQEEALRQILQNGFTYNGVHYSRFGKSASQAKEGITAFVCDEMFDELYRITQMDIEISECVISKYEAQRCLPFSTCTVIKDYMPNIVIIGEFKKILPRQLIKYAVEREGEFTDPETGENKKYKIRELEEGLSDIELSPFDGCGCHEEEFMSAVSSDLGLDYNAAGVQVRMPFIKGYSVYVPFRRILREWGCESVTDIYGREHPIDSIDCIWNTSMFKGHGLFKEKYGNNAWNEYMKTVKKYGLKLGISKYSHHIKQLNKYTRMNFQYLQCLDLWNPKYIENWENKNRRGYDILSPDNDGKITGLARYTTSLFEKIIKGDKFYTFKFMGITDTENYEPESGYIEAVLTNDTMLRDPAVRQFIYRKLKKAVCEAKVGKIYCPGFYHTGVGDMIGYLQFAAGLEPEGCLKEHELYSGALEPGECLSFRSPLVDPSEVNRVKIVHSETLAKWFGHFEEQDIVMFNMHDISAPQQGGADFDGDIFFLCTDPVMTASKIDKPIVLDISDKATALSRPYTKENLIEYEIMTRDSRIGEITNAATSIENKYTTDPTLLKKYGDYASLLRLYQGKEIDFLKTGYRWHMNRALRKYLKQLPYFLLFNYPGEMKLYRELCEKNRSLGEDEEHVRLNAYRSPSPMNELCDYICAWEKKHILWDADPEGLALCRELILDKNLELSDKKALRVCRRYINDYAAEIRRHMEIREKPDSQTGSPSMDALTDEYKARLLAELDMDEPIIAGYVIKASYSSLSVSKAFAWAAYGDRILDNLRRSTPPNKNISIREVTHGGGYHGGGYRNDSPCYEYLGKYYEFKETN